MGYFLIEDPEGNRIAKTDTSGTTTYTIDPHGDALPRVLVREKPDGSLTRYVYGIGLLYEVDESDVASYYHYDQSGSTIALTDISGALTDRVEYSPYGTITHRTGSTDTPFLYAGQFGVQQEPNGLLHMRARYYSPELRRFINTDPIGFAGGMNWYAYANNSPLLYVDPDGEHPLLVLALIGGISNVATGAALAAVTGQEYGLRDAALDFGIGATFGGASGATIKAARFYKALKFTTSSRESWKFDNVRKALQRSKWGVLPKGQPIHHWLIPQNTWGKHVPARIKNQPWNLIPARNRVWHDGLHGKGRNALRIDKRLWHGSPTWARIGAAGTGVSLGNHASRNIK